MQDRSENPVLRHCIDNNKIGTTSSITELPGGATVTLRDLFAAAALTGIGSNVNSETDTVPIAEWCGRMANAMLEERGKR